MRLVSPSHFLLISVAAIWGFAFVAQSAGMAHLGPHSFNAARFLLGALSLVPVWLLMGGRRLPQGRVLVLGGIGAGTLLFGGFSFQQVGLLYTSAGNAGFITGMYIVLVPLAGLFLGRRGSPQTWTGVLLAMVGLFSLSVGPDFTMAYGDLLELIGALFWTAHVIVIGWLSRQVDPVGLSIVQFLVAAFWATLAALALEKQSLAGFQGAWLPLLYAGVASSGIAFTLQAIGQRRVDPGVAALILSMEALFAALGCWLLLDEVLTDRQLLGCGLMLAGMLVSQWPARRREAVGQAAA